MLPDFESDAVSALVKGTGAGGVAGEDLARAMPRALAASIRAAVNALEDINRLMADGPLEGLDTVSRTRRHIQQ